MKEFWGYWRPFRKMAATPPCPTGSLADKCIMIGRPQEYSAHYVCNPPPEGAATPLVGPWSKCSCKLWSYTAHWCTEKDSTDSVCFHEWTACHNRHGSPNTSESKQRLWCLPHYDYRTQCITRKGNHYPGGSKTTQGVIIYVVKTIETTGGWKLLT